MSQSAREGNSENKVDFSKSTYYIQQNFYILWIVDNFVE